ncbi:phosphatidate cytidylyltransferase [uncultured Neptuniibacter sp.]|uniref:phosphatidate cytidylyltransferase n=1 Tax=uncultured Neptuniibacter sp. TaxID=502143 RepID=UPI00261CAC34|nr:phosphatidate cytidylyltransferase [uncultured Neptuniibacter sp.]
MLKQRILTAVILAPLALMGVFLLPLEQFIFLLDGAILLAAWEWANLAGIRQSSLRSAYVVLMACVIFLCHAFYEVLPVHAVLFTSLIAWLVALYWVVQYPKSEGWSKEWQRGVIGYLVLLPCWFAFVSMKATENGEVLIVLLFLLVWGADVGAYFSGKRFGCNKLAPDVSPGKTREGLYGGLVTCLVVAVGFAVYMDLSATQTALMILLSLLTGLISVLGDLFESMLKRFRGIKDSSQLLPGHGGVLDRIDSLTAAAPLFVLGMHFLMVT